MTAQVAVLNLNGIAVASDTYVTTYSNNGSAKSMGNSNKILELGNAHRVLVLHSGSTEINGVPHALHIAEWAKTLAQPLPTLQAYVDSYRTWAAGDRRIVTFDSEGPVINRVLNDKYYEIAGNASRAMDSLVFDENTTDRKRKADQKKAAQESISEDLKNFSEWELFPGVTERSALKALADHDFNIPEKVEYIFSRFELSAPELQKLVDFAAVILTRNEGWMSDSELGFVGFGDDEPFGGVIRLSCRGIYGGLLVASTQPRFDIHPSRNPSGISYFAQRDAMWGFVNGFTTGIRDEYHRRIWSKVEEKWGAETQEPIGWNLAEEIDSEIADYAQEEFVQPMLNTMEAMGLPSLADLADALVGLQALATFSKPGTATVGGLIEVATIDRINGISWRRRLEN